jgi:Holliday junction resolvasome RuvABC ATP-dependent DNA helicase subunit
MHYLSLRAASEQQLLTTWHMLASYTAALQLNLSCWRMLQAASGDFPHCLFYGPPGAGKKTLIMAVLREVYGP